MGESRDDVNSTVAEYVREVREGLERGRAEIERQKQALRELHATSAEHEAAA